MAAENPFARIFNQQPSQSLVSLAVLEPGLPDSPLKISLTQVDPKDTVYDCISYDRSKTSETLNISLHDEPFAVPIPLYTALQELRYEDKPRNLWADLLLGDEPEQRSKQAAEMKTVLEHATNLYIWLGAGDESSGSTFDALQSLANLWQQARIHSGMPVSFTKATSTQVLQSREYVLANPVPALTGWGSLEVIDNVERALSSPYFETVQSIPEIVLAVKSRVVRQGKSSISLDDYFGAFCAFLNFRGTLLKKGVSEYFQLINSLNIAIRRKGEGESLELLPMLQGAQDTKASDSRESVFAMLPIISASRRTAENDDRPAPLAADYSLSTEEVYKQAARYIVLDRQDLLLWMSQRPPVNRQIEGLPSWVPDFSTQPTKITKSRMLDHHIRKWADPLTSKRIRVDDEYGLHIQAHTLARIAYVSAIITPKNCRSICLDLLQRLNDLNSSTSSRQVLFENLWRTLVLDCDSSGATLGTNSRPPAALGQSFQSVFCEERICQLLGCTREQLFSDPTILAQARTREDVAILGPMTGRSEAFEELLRSNALGRRYFQTESGEMGMSAVESVAAAAGEEEEEATANAQGAAPPRAPDFSAAMADPFGRMMMEQFQRHLQQQNPQMAAFVSDAVEGRLDIQQKTGIRAGDLIVVIVGGFYPYVLRPVQRAQSEQQGSPAGNASGTSAELDEESKYRYIGECYLHGSMEGEPLKVRNWLGMKTYNTNLKVVDITLI